MLTLKSWGYASGAGDPCVDQSTSRRWGCSPSKAAQTYRWHLRLITAYPACKRSLAWSAAILLWLRRNLICSVGSQRWSDLEAGRRPKPWVSQFHDQWARIAGTLTPARGDQISPWSSPGMSGNTGQCPAALSGLANHECRISGGVRRREAEVQQLCSGKPGRIQVPASKQLIPAHPAVSPFDLLTTSAPRLHQFGVGCAGRIGLTLFLRQCHPSGEASSQ